jgi:hypothetical protein
MGFGCRKSCRGTKKAEQSFRKHLQRVVEHRNLKTKSIKVKTNGEKVPKA